MLCPPERVRPLSSAKRFDWLLVLVLVLVLGSQFVVIVLELVRVRIPAQHGAAAHATAQLEHGLRGRLARWHGKRTSASWCLAWVPLARDGNHELSGNARREGGGRRRSTRWTAMPRRPR